MQHGEGSAVEEGRGGSNRAAAGHEEHPLNLPVPPGGEELLCSWLLEPAVCSSVARHLETESLLCL